MGAPPTPAGVEVARALLAAGEASGPVIVREPGTDANRPDQAFIIRVFADKASLDEATNSRIRHLFGVSPLFLAGWCMLGAALAGVPVFLLSRRLATIRAVRGKGRWLSD